MSENTPNINMFAKLNEEGKIIRQPFRGDKNLPRRLKWLTAHGFEERTEEWFREHAPKPTVADTAAFDAACAQFRAICGQIGTAIGKPGFKGGFDEMAEFQASEVYATVEGLQLAVAWSAANELCKYEGSKIKLGQPAWWYKCWEDTHA